MSELSRRDFLKGSLAGAASLAMAGIGLGAVKSTASAAGIYTPGTYSATADGIGTVTVTATFDENSITEILLDVSGETPSIGQAAKDGLIEQIMAAQSAEIDGVAGATITSTAIRKAEDEAEKARASELSDARAKASGNGESVDQVVSSLFKEAASGSGKRQVDSYLSEYSSWSVYGNFQMPSTWFLDGLFSLANAELPSDLEHASFAARKAYGMVPATPTKALFALAEARADGKLSRRKLDQVFAVVFENGLGPWIDERQFHIPVPYKDRIYTLSFALPKLVRRDAAYSKLVVRDGAVALGETSTVGEMDRVAVREFKARMPSIVAAQMFSAAVKVGLQIAIVEAARRKGGDEAAAFTSYLTSLAGVAATGTDTRHWNLLPKNIQAAMLRKPQTPDRAVELWVPGAAAPLAKVFLPETGLSVIYVKVPRPGLPPLVRILGDSR